MKNANEMTKYLYICSAGHSGSTLLDLLLGSHSRIESLGEITHLPKNIALNTTCTCGQTVRSCQYWLEIVNRTSSCVGFDIFTTPYRFDLGFINPKFVIDRQRQTVAYVLRGKLMRGIRYSQLALDMSFPSRLSRPFDTAVDNTFILYNNVRQIRQARIVVDSSKAYLKAIDLYKKTPEAFKLIVLTRDGRGVLYSNLKRNASRRKSVNGWINYYSRALRLIKRHISGEHVLYLKYEDLASSPQKELERICEFAGIEFETEMLDFARHPHHNTNGNNMRFRRNSEIRLDDAWKRKLTKSDLDYFDRVAGKINKELGY